MKVSGPVLKSLVKKLAPANAPVVMLNTADGQLSAVGTDLAMVASSAALREDQGRRAVVDHRQLSSIASKFTGEVELNITDQALEIATKKARFLLAQSKGTAPNLPAADNAAEYSLCPLKRILAHAATAADSKQRFSYEGSIQVNAVGASVSDSKGRLTISAAGADGRRLAVAQEAFDKASGGKFLLPVAAVAAIETMDGDFVRISESDAAVILAAGDSVSGQVVVAKKLAKQFPDFRHLLPERSKFRATIKTAELKEALETLSPIVASDDLKKVEMNFSGGSLSLRSCVSGSVAEETIDYVQFFPDPILDEMLPVRVGLNHKYLDEFVINVKQDTIDLCANDARDPVILRAGDCTLLVAQVR